MDISTMKNIVILKDLPSNMIEEAIVILKQNQKIKNLKLRESEQEKQKTDPKKITKDYVVKEAEMLVSSYISSMEKPKQIRPNNAKLQKKYQRLQIVTAILGFVCMVLLLI